MARASVLILCSVLLACGGATPSDAGPSVDAGDAGRTDAGHTDAGGNDAGELDAGAREAFADVTAVSATGSEGAYTFSVAVRSSDTGCAHYADWWEVVREDGTLVYRRTLAHSHTDENGTTDPGAPGNTFTRTGGPVDVLPDQVVVVRAHLHPEGYVGEVMRGSVVDGFTRFTPAPGFAASLAEAPPRPPACAF